MVSAGAMRLDPPAVVSGQGLGRPDYGSASASKIVMMLLRAADNARLGFAMGLAGQARRFLTGGGEGE